MDASHMRRLKKNEHADTDGGPKMPQTGFPDSDAYDKSCNIYSFPLAKRAYTKERARLTDNKP